MTPCSANPARRPPSMALRCWDCAHRTCVCRWWKPPMRRAPRSRRRCRVPVCRCDERFAAGKGNGAADDFEHHRMTAQGKARRMAMKKDEGFKIIADNRKARYAYAISDTL